jgi:integrase
MTALRQPKLRRHKPSGRAVVTIDRHDHYLGPWPAGTKKPPAEVQTRYHRLLAEHATNGAASRSRKDAAASLTIEDLILAYYRHAESYYRRPDGTVTNEVSDIRLSLRPLRRLYATLPIADFGPLRLEAVRQAMLDARRYRVRPAGDPEAPAKWLADNDVRPQEGIARFCREWVPVEIIETRAALCRGVINHRIGRIVRMFKWAVSKQIAPVTVYQALKTVPGLRRARSTARETEPVGPVPEAHALAILPYVLPPVAAMVRLQLLTGARSGELCTMRACDLDVSGPVWLYRPASHKTQHHGRSRIIALGKQAQEIVKPFLTTNLEAYLFSPRAGLEEVRRLKRERRKTRVQPSQQNRRKRRSRRTPGERYDTRSYAHAVRHGCIKANVPHFHPHQLRHTHATKVRRRFGLEAAQVALGHATAQVTELYAERDLAHAMRIAAEIG